MTDPDEIETECFAITALYNRPLRLLADGETIDAALLEETYDDLIHEVLTQDFGHD